MGTCKSIPQPVLQPIAACNTVGCRCGGEDEGEVFIYPARMLCSHPGPRPSSGVASPQKPPTDWHSKEPQVPVRQVGRDLFRAAARAVALAPRFRLDPGKKRSYALDRRVDSATIFQMDQDLPRTAGSDPLVRAKRGVIRALLLRQLAEDPDLGYCQGMNFAAAVFAVGSRDAEEAYERFHGFAQKMRGLWLPGFPLLEMGVAHFATVAKERPWFQHLSAYDVRPSMFMPQALLTLFAMWLPLPTVVACLAMLETHGLLGMVALTVAVLDLARERLLRKDSMEDLLNVFRQLHETPPEAKELVSAARRELPRCRSRSGAAEELMSLLQGWEERSEGPDAVMKAAERVQLKEKRPKEESCACFAGGGSPLGTKKPRRGMDHRVTLQLLRGGA